MGKGNGFLSWLVPIFLVLLAFGPRLYGLGTFVHSDEMRWIERSTRFICAVGHGDWAATFQHHHPGVSAMWGYGLLLWTKYLLAGDPTGLCRVTESGDYDMLSLIPLAALFNVLVTCLTVVAIYLLLRRLWPYLALLSGLLVATDPTYLVNSRMVHIDGPLAGYMTLSALFLIVYLQDHQQKPYLLASGIFGGLALLDKTPALVLVPFAALALAIHRLLSKREEQGWKGISAPLFAFLLWLLVVVLTFVILWPALWVEPRLNLARLWEVTEWAIESPHEMGNFFLGRPVDDPGWLYYPVQAAFRLTPLTLPFFLLSLVFFCLLALGRLEPPPLLGGASSHRGLLEAMGLALLYSLADGLMVSLSSKKLERYLLPTFPMIDILAAVGLLTFLGWMGRLLGHDLKGRLLIGATSGFILLLSTSWLRLAPYYSAYLNPLVGGAALAPKTLLIGGAEGLDLAARYLDSKDKAQDLTVATWGPETVRLYFKGRTIPLRWLEWTRVWTLADYALFHVSQVQRQYPDEETVAFFQAREPEYVAGINGIDYAWVYKTPLLLSGQPSALSRSLQVSLGDQLLLLGYDLSSATSSPGDDLYLTLHWQALKSTEKGYNIFICLQGETGRLWLEEGQPFDGFYPTKLWPPGEVLLDRHRLTLPLDLSLGRYQLAVGMRDPDSGEVLAVEGEEGVVIETLEIVGRE
ncbi:MAG: ArnT family glycosyltransferase [Anaerolineae bacterium]